MAENCLFLPALASVFARLVQLQIVTVVGREEQLLFATVAVVFDVLTTDREEVRLKVLRSDRIGVAENNSIGIQ